MEVEIFKSNTSPPRMQPWYVRLVSQQNGQTLNVSEGYFSKWNAKRAAKRVYPHLRITDFNTGEVIQEATL